MRILLALLLMTSMTFAEPITGRATVVYGDTIAIHRERIRFNGIEAPESRQFCQKCLGKHYRCGKIA